MDEVLTGFRVTSSGWYGVDGVAGDLVTFGKVMGGGLPCAAFGGRAEIMSRLAPAGPVYQAGTLSGNPLAVAAGLATLRSCTAEVYARVDEAAAAVAKLASAALTAAGVPFWLSEAGNLFSVFLGRTAPVQSFADAKDQSAAAYAAFFHAMLDGGVYLPPSPFEAWFLSAAHDEAALARIADALPARRRSRRRRAQRIALSSRSSSVCPPAHEQPGHHQQEADHQGDEPQGRPCGRTGEDVRRLPGRAGAALGCWAGTLRARAGGGGRRDLRDEPGRVFLPPAHRQPGHHQQEGDR